MAVKNEIKNSFKNQNAKVNYLLSGDIDTDSDSDLNSGSSSEEENAIIELDQVSGFVMIIQNKYLLI